MKKILIINSGWEQIDLIKRAKQLDCYVIATDASPNAPGFEFADETFVIDPRNIPDLLNLAMNSQINGVIADQCDYSFYTAAFIAEKMGLPGAELSTVQKCTNKKWMRQACERAGILQPKYYPCKTFDEVQEVIKAIGYPAIVKPVDNRGNFGVNKVDNDQELKDAFYEAIANSHSRECLVEEFINGTMTTVDGFAISNRHESLAIASKKMLGGNKRVAMEITYPAGYTEVIMKKLEDNHNRVANALGITFGCSHGEYMVTDAGDIYLIECANRGGGCYTSSRIVPSVSGLDINKMLIQISLGEECNFPVAYNGMIASTILSFIQCRPGKIKEILNVDKITEDESVLAFRLSVKPQDIVSSITNDANRHGFVIATGKTVKEAKDKVEWVKDTLEVIYDE